MGAKLSALGREEKRKSHLRFGSALTRVHLGAMSDKFGPVLFFLQACSRLTTVSVSELLVASQKTQARLFQGAHDPAEEKGLPTYRHQL